MCIAARSFFVTCEYSSKVLFWTHVKSKEQRVKSRTPTRDRAGRGPTRTQDPAAHIRGFGRRGGGRREIPPHTRARTLLAGHAPSHCSGRGPGHPRALTQTASAAHSSSHGGGEGGKDCGARPLHACKHTHTHTHARARAHRPPPTHTCARTSDPVVVVAPYIATCRCARHRSHCVARARARRRRLRSACCRAYSSPHMPQASSSSSAAAALLPPLPRAPRYACFTLPRPAARRTASGMSL